MFDQSQDQDDSSQDVDQSQDQDQPEITGGSDEQLIEVNGEELSMDELKKGYMRNADYTRKTQRLAQDKSKTLEDIEESNPELYQAVVQLREAWVATKDDIAATVEETLERIKAKEGADASAKNFFEDYPALVSSKKAILELSKNTGLTPEEVAITYNFMDKDQKRTREVKGKFAPKEKSYTDLSRAEKDAFINSGTSTNKNSFWGS